MTYIDLGKVGNGSDVLELGVGGVGSVLAGRGIHGPAELWRDNVALLCLLGQVVRGQEGRVAAVELDVRVVIVARVLRHTPVLQVRRLFASPWRL